MFCGLLVQIDDNFTPYPDLNNKSQFSRQLSYLDMVQIYYPGKLDHRITVNWYIDLWRKLSIQLYRTLQLLQYKQEKGSLVYICIYTYFHLWSYDIILPVSWYTLSVLTRIDCQEWQLHVSFGSLARQCDINHTMMVFCSIKGVCAVFDVHDVVIITVHTYGFNVGTYILLLYDIALWYVLEATEWQAVWLMHVLPIYAYNYTARV